ncbi:thiamine diphosphokinase [Marinifilum sp.]|uniref:thiamine diphosphokinase n=1 Tax=Marinifilum sp. TaxID=2033137 RepID=UPI003BA8727E
MYKKSVILANGAFPTHEIPLNELKESKHIICCDGAINKLEKAGLEPFAIIGDLDSLNPELKFKYKDRIHHYSNQDNNDLSKAVDWCVANKYNEISIVGATGERDDHMIGNIFLLPQYAKKLKVKMLTDFGFFTPVNRSKNFDSYTRQQVSVFSPDRDTVITTANLRYALTNQTLELMWQGTLNESMGDSFRIEFEGGPLIVFQEY